jgi:hypothetical protein
VGVVVLPLLNPKHYLNTTAADRPEFRRQESTIRPPYPKAEHTPKIQPWTNLPQSRHHFGSFPGSIPRVPAGKFFIGGGMMGHGMMGCGTEGDDMPDAKLIRTGMMQGGMMGHGMMNGKCQVVEGPISHMGWCDLYAAEPDDEQDN